MKKALMPLFGFFFYVSLSQAAIPEQTHVASTLLDIFSGVGSAFSGICLVIGISLIFSSFIQYHQHRMNKLLVPISRPIVLLILGIVLCCVPVLGHYTMGGQLIESRE